ncbi:hypothetical protein PoMZ_13076, partial [Pyricularia oryzae]
MLFIDTVGHPHTLTSTGWVQPTTRLHITTSGQCYVHNEPRALQDSKLGCDKPWPWLGRDIWVAKSSSCSHRLYYGVVTKPFDQVSKAIFHHWPVLKGLGINQFSCLHIFFIDLLKP